MIALLTSPAHAALTMMFFTAITFMQEDIPGLRVSSVDSLSGLVSTNYRQADLDGDGKLDLLLPDEVFFQRGGGFPAEGRTPMPGAIERAHGDIWDGSIYLWFPDRLEVVRWESTEWNRIAEQSLARPEKIDGYESASEVNTGVWFDRFLHDLDGDGSPEIVVPGEKGIHIYSKGENEYLETVCLDVLPSLHFFQPPRQPLWPPESRQIAFPRRGMTCRFFFEGNGLTIIDRKEGPDTRIVYRIRRYTLDVKDGYSLMHGTTYHSVSEPLPAHFRPCRLNDDDFIDFAGGDWTLSTSSPLPMPIYETSASTDNGKTLQSIRTPSFQPQCSFVDFDEDGDLDMIAESTGLFDGGTRECISRILTSDRVEHEIAVYFQNGQGVFSKSPDVRGRFSLILDTPPSRGSFMFQRYQSSELFDITGDFNRDRRRDVVVQDRPGRLAVFFNRDDRFSTRPDALVTIPENARFGVTDVNGDGRSDIVVRWYASSPEPMTEHNCVYLTQKDAP